MMPEQAGRELVHAFRDYLQTVQATGSQLQRLLADAPNAVQEIILTLLASTDKCSSTIHAIQEHIPVNRTPPLKIVVVEDNIPVRQEIVFWLQEKGHQVVGEAAMAAQMILVVLDRKPDLVVFDIGLPDGSGLDAFQEIMKVFPVPAVIVTGHADVDDMLSEIDGNLIMAYLVKPFNKDTMLAQVSVAWNRYQVYKQAAERMTKAEDGLADYKIVQKAKARLMDQRGWSDFNAYKAMQTAAKNRNLRMIDIALAINDGELAIVDAVDLDTTDAPHRYDIEKAKRALISERKLSYANAFEVIKQTSARLKKSYVEVARMINESGVAVTDEPPTS